MNATLSTLSTSLEQRRKAMGLSFIDLARETGVSRQAIYRLFHGQDVQLTTLMAVCKVLQLDVIAIPVGVGSLVEKAQSPSSQTALPAAANAVPPGRSKDPLPGAVPPQSSVPSALELRMGRLRAGAMPSPGGKRS